MAYLDLSTLEPTHGSFATGAATVAPSFFMRPSLSSRERAAVLLARSDRSSSLRTTTYISKVIEALFGLRRPNRLADVRLEALRRFAVAVANDRRHLADWERVELRTLQFDESQIEEAAALAGKFRKARSSDGWILPAVSLVLTAVFLWMQRYLDDTPVAIIGTLVLAAPFFAAVCPRPANRSDWNTKIG